LEVVCDLAQSALFKEQLNTFKVPGDHLPSAETYHDFCPRQKQRPAAGPLLSCVRSLAITTQRSLGCVQWLDGFALAKQCG
jgi:hypothetical protein